MGTQPNILFILTDQMRGDCLSALGHPVVETPHIDELAPSSHGRLGYEDRVPWTYAHMLPQVLGDAGYQTHCVGKTHFYPQNAHCGFQSIDSYEGRQNFDGLYVNDYFEWLREKSGGLLEEHDHGLNGNSWDARPSHLPEELHNNTWTATMAIRFLKRRDRTRPFFLNVSFVRPHAPLDPPQAMFDLYKDRGIPPVPVGDWARIHDVPIGAVDAWHGRLPERRIAAARRAYYAQIAHIDFQVGRIMEALQREIRPGPTWVVFASDHGEMMGDHHLWRKSYAYEGSAKIPLVIRGIDGGIGRVCGAPVVCEDLYPTILAMAGASAPAPVDGRSLLPFLADAGRVPDRAYVHGEHSACYAPGEAMQYLTDGREKFFDLASDPSETKDLSADPRFRERLSLWRARMVGELSGRTEDGLSDGIRLLPGKLLPAVRRPARS